MQTMRAYHRGFTLIELSIVLVIIGLIIGGVLVGQNLIDAAATRAQLTQIEKYNSAVNTFRVKYGYIPGDIPDPYASQFGFKPRGTVPGTGDGDGFLLGYNGGAAANQQSAGETVMFWVDLSTANMIDGSFTSATSTSSVSISGTYTPLYFPAAKIGNGNYVYVYGGGYWNGSGWSNNGFNYYGIVNISFINNAGLYSTPALTVAQAYNMDKKVDDGLPQSGKVTANYINGTINGGVAPVWAAGGGAVQGANGGGLPIAPTNASTPGTSSTCYDNGSGSGPQQYSMEISNGSNPNCALSFVMQGAAR